MKWTFTIAGPILIIAIAVAAYFYWPSNAPLAEADPRPFATSVSFVRHADQTPLDVMELQENTGLYVDLTFALGAEIPELYDGKEVQSPQTWPLAVAITPRQRFGKPQTVRMIVRPDTFRPPNRPYRETFRGVPVGGSGTWNKRLGFKGPPDPLPGWKKDEARFWAYFSAGTDKSGEFVYEIVAYPTAKWVSSVRYIRGPEIVLKRGLLHVSPTDKDAGSSVAAK
jgi:hypothetical protein